MPPITVPPEACQDWTHAGRLEWLETNGTGGFAMGTVAGANTRRYHALLTASLNPPVQRKVLFSRVEEELTILPNGLTTNLGAAQYPGVVSPQGFHHIQSFRLDPYPIWRYQFQDATLEKSFFLVHGQQTAVLRYTLSEGPAIRLRVRTFLANRDYHSLQHGHPNFIQDPLRIHHNSPKFIPDAHWYYQNEYLLESERGLDFTEDLWSPGFVEWELTPGSPAAFLVATIEPHDTITATQIDHWDQAEKQRRNTSPKFRHRLNQAAAQFTVHRADGSPTIIAGYPWFTDWGRDTMISLPGLLLTRGLHTEAIQILDGFLRYRNRGLIPNRFPDAGDSPEYNTADATLWAFIAAWELHRRGLAAAYLKDRFYPAAIEILDWHRRGTDYGIAADPEDGLLYAGGPNTQLTWMDAKVGNWVVTPRAGKPVEINALWYNALRITAALSPDPNAAARLTTEAGQVQHSFERRFWNPDTECLYDVIDPTDPAIRPNQLFALSLPFPLLDKPRQQAILRTIDQRLLTPYGLRTLDPQHPDYQGRYTGNPSQRDAAYHQGTVWPWLLGPYIHARIEAHGRTPENLSRCHAILNHLEPELYQGCLGTLGEIYEADPPHRPAGAPAQAWSVAELLRALEALETQPIRGRKEAVAEY